MPRQIVLNQVTLCADGSVGIQWLKQFVDDTTGEVLFSEPHRSIVPFDGDVDDQVSAVRDHLAAMGYPAVPDAQLEVIRQVHAVGLATPTIEAVRQDKLAQKAAYEAEQAAILKAETDAAEKAVDGN